MAQRPSIASASLLAASFILLAVLSPCHVEGITYAQDVAAAEDAIAATPGYVILSSYRNILTATLRRNPDEQPPATILAPNDTAILATTDVIGQKESVLYPVVQFHALQGVHYLQDLSALAPYTPLATFNPAGVLDKISPAGLEPVQFKSATRPAIGTVTKLIYSGTYIVVYGIDTVLLP